MLAAQGAQGALLVVDPALGLGAAGLGRLHLGGDALAGFGLLDLFPFRGGDFGPGPG